VEAARSVGLTEGAILRRHILRNVLPLIVTQCMILFPLVLQIEAALGFLGLGVQPPTPDRARSSRRGRTTSGLPPDVDLPGTCRPRDGARPYPRLPRAPEADRAEVRAADPRRWR